MTTHDEATIREALRRLTTAAWHQNDPERPKACFSIPADPERDADLILGAAIDELVAARAQLDATARRESPAPGLVEAARDEIEGCHSCPYLHGPVLFGRWQCVHPANSCIRYLTGDDGKYVRITAEDDEVCPPTWCPLREGPTAVVLRAALPKETP